MFRKNWFGSFRNACESIRAYEFVRCHCFRCFWLFLFFYDFDVVGGVIKKYFISLILFLIMISENCVWSVRRILEHIKWYDLRYVVLKISMFWIVIEGHWIDFRLVLIVFHENLFWNPKKIFEGLRTYQIWRNSGFRFCVILL